MTSIINVYVVTVICSLLPSLLILAQHKVSSKDTPKQIRNTVSKHLENGRINDLLSYLNSVEKLYGSLLIDSSLPSLYNYKGVALHNSQQLEESESAFLEGLKYFPTDTRSLLNLGETRTQLFKLDQAIEVFERAEALGETSALSKLLRAKGWSASWYDFERIAAGVEREAVACASTGESTSTACQTGLIINRSTYKYYVHIDILIHLYM